MKSTEVTTVEWIKRMKATTAWRQREMFKVADMAKTLRCGSETVGRVCRDLYRDGMIERFERNGKALWCAPVPSVLSMSWRKHTNQQLGIA